MTDRQNSTVNGTVLADDIVTRLREHQRELEFWWPDDDPPLTLVGEAADEIERLRAELEQSRQDHLATFLELMEERCG